MYRLDRTAFKIQTWEEASNDPEYWLAKTPAERFAAASYLIAAAYNYPLNNPPRLDKTCFKITKRSSE